MLEKQNQTIAKNWDRVRKLFTKGHKNIFQNNGTILSIVVF